MKAAPFTYCRPDTVSEALEVLAEEGADAKVLAGGQSLLPLMYQRLARPSVVVDISRIGVLAAVEVAPKHVSIGAGVVQGDVMTRTDLPLLGRALPHVGHHQTRVRGTVCGSVVYADPLAEVPLVMLVNGGELQVASSAGSRFVDIDAFLSDAFAPALRADELVVASVWRRLDPSAGVSFVELAHGATVCASAAVAERTDEIAVRLRIGVNGVVGRPRCLETSVARRGPSPADIADELVGGLEFVEDDVAPARYRRELARELATRAASLALDSCS